MRLVGTSGLQQFPLFSRERTCVHVRSFQINLVVVNLFFTVRMAHIFSESCIFLNHAGSCVLSSVNVMSLYSFFAETRDRGFQFFDHVESIKFT